MRGIKRGFFFLLLGLPLCASGLELPTPWTWPITSDYGPRNVSTGTWFHEGIDYGGGFEKEIPAVSSGAIGRIGTFRGGGYGIAVKDNENRTWWYFHLFTDGLLPRESDESNWELWPAKLKHKVTGKVSDETVIILWSDKIRYRASKVFVVNDLDDQLVYIHKSTPVFTSDGTSTITARGWVKQHEPIAPVGNSGVGTGAHLDLRLNGGKDNPLLYLAHNQGGMGLSLTAFPEGYMFKPEDLSRAIPIEVVVNSTAGLNLDKLFLRVDAWDGQRHHLYGEPSFSYGGRLDSEVGGGTRTAGVRPCAEGLPCVEPQSNGVDRFRLEQVFGDLHLTGGSHVLTAEAVDIRGNAHRASVWFRTPGNDALTGPAVTVHSLGPLYENFRGTSAVVPSTLERDHEITASEEFYGVSTMTITGPSGVLYNERFVPPAPSTTVYLTGMATGQYTITAFSGGDVATVLPFRIDSLEIELSTGASWQRYVSESLTAPGTFYVDIALRARSTAGLASVELRTLETGVLIAEQAVSGEEAETVFYNIPVVTTSVWGVFDLVAFARDKAGNQKARDELFWDPSVMYTQLPATEDSLYCGGNYTGPVQDLTALPGGAFLPGAMAENFFIGQDSITGEFYVVNDGIAGLTGLYDLGFYQNLQLDEAISDGAIVGDFSTTIYSSDDPGMSGGVESRIHTYRVIFRDNQTSPPSFRFEYEPLTAPARFPLKRYFRAESSYPCMYPGTLAMYASFHLNGLGVRADDEMAPYFEKHVFAGFGVRTQLSKNVSAIFDEVTVAGGAGVTARTALPPIGRRALPVNTAFNIQTTAEFTGAELSFAYDNSGLSGSQEDGIKLLRLGETGYEELPTTVNRSLKTASAHVTSFGTFVVAAPAYSNPLTASAGMGTEITADVPLTAETIPDNSLFYAAAVKNLSAAGLAPVSGIHYIGPDNTPLSPAGALTLSYDKTRLAALGVPEENVSAYQFTAAGNLMFRLPRQELLADASLIKAEVPKLYSLFAALAPVQPVQETDIMRPETLFVHYGVSYSTGDGEPVFISSANPSGLEAEDDGGIRGTYYFLGRYPDFGCLRTAPDVASSTGTCANPRYAGPFTLSEGTHTVHYFSADNAGNYEEVRSTSVYVDGTPPAAEAFAAGSAVADGGTAYILATDSITLTAVDPVSNGVSSGQRDIYYLVDLTMDDCPEGEPPFTGQGTGAFAGPPGTCSNPRYEGPFTLPVGEHVVYYLAQDNVGNQAPVKNARIEVKPAGDSMPAGYVRKIAGTGAFGYSGDGGDALDAVLGYPVGSAVDKHGNLLFADASYHVVRKITPDGKIYTLAGRGYGGFAGDGGPAWQATLNQPYDVAVDSRGNIYVADSGNHRVRRIDAETGVITTAAKDVYHSTLDIGQTFSIG
jgi:hypothetical protein